MNSAMWPHPDRSSQTTYDSSWKNSRLPPRQPSTRIVIAERAPSRYAPVRSARRANRPGAGGPLGFGFEPAPRSSSDMNSPRGGMPLGRSAMGHPAAEDEELVGQVIQD